MRIFVAVLTFSLFDIPLCVVINAERESYLNCDVYTDRADIPRQNTICHRHFTQRKFYCRTWQCETPRCPLSQQITRTRDCPYCPNTCTRWGKIYNARDRYRCQDGSNYCLCIGGDDTVSTRMATSVYSICRWFAKWDQVDLPKTFSLQTVLFSNQKTSTCG